MRPDRLLLRGTAVLTLLVCSGCWAYWPLRLPQRDLFLPTRAYLEPISSPPRSLGELSYQLRQDGISVGMDLLSPERAEQVFHQDLARHGIQPVLLALRNDSERTYRFRKADLSRRVIPSSRVAAIQYPQPIRIVSAYARWVALFLPGLLFETVVEPACQFDFPILHQGSRHPSWPHPRDIRRMFEAQELPDGELPPGQTRAGAVFLRAVPLDSTLTLTVRDAQTQEPVTLTLPTPSRMVSQVRVDDRPPAEVWPAALQSAKRVSSWRIASADQQAGVITIRKRSEMEAWGAATPITVRVTPVAGQTQVTAESPLREPVSTSLGTSSQTVEHFFLEMSNRLPPTAPPPAATPPPAPVGQSDSGYGAPNG